MNSPYRDNLEKIQDIQYYSEWDIFWENTLNHIWLLIITVAVLYIEYLDGE